ncbi:MAG: hypothetical protein ACRD1G_09975 [Acidimicrobiales bacterium]
MRPAVSAACSAALALLLGGCFSGTTAVCPRIAIVPDLKSIAKFGPGPGRDVQDIDYGARMLAATVSCSFDKKKGGLDVATKLGITALRGKPAIRKGQVTYFVAVVDRRETILSKRDFVIDITFPTSQPRVEVTEEHDEFIPMPQTGTGAEYGILFGFQLTPEELQYNRDHEPKGPG